MMFGFSLYAASTEAFVVIVNEHGPVPLHPLPVQPVNVDAVTVAVSGVEVSMTVVPKLTLTLQVVPQFTPLPVTVPAPSPLFVTLSVNCCSVNVAVTLRAAVITTVHVPVPVQPPPDQPVKLEPVDGDAVSVTDLLKS
jgi:hypothetical protein